MLEREYTEFSDLGFEFNVGTRKESTKKKDKTHMAKKGKQSNKNNKQLSTKQNNQEEMKEERKNKSNTGKIEDAVSKNKDSIGVKNDRQSEPEEVVININSLKTMESLNDSTIYKQTTMVSTNNNETILQALIKKNKIKEELEKSKKTQYVLKQNILTRAEGILYDKLIELLGDRVIVLSKIRMADVFDIKQGVKYDASSKIFRDIAMKHLDYLILDRETKQLICVVELDDETHQTEQAENNDAFKDLVVRDCGISLFRTRKKIDTLTLYDLGGLLTIVNNFYAPTCELCGRPMEERMGTSQGNVGNRFYGCTGFPDKCRHTVRID